MHSYWNGYYTSRPAFKRFERASNGVLQAGKQVNALLNGGKEDELRVLANAVAIAQHHDAITGTARQAVDEDYNDRLW